MNKAEQYAHGVLGEEADEPYAEMPIFVNEDMVPSGCELITISGRGTMLFRYEWDDGSAIVYNGMEWAYGLTVQQMEDGAGAEIEADSSFCLFDERFQPAVRFSDAI